MANSVAGILSVTGRLLFVGIFLLSAVGNKIPQFGSVVEAMRQVGVPAPPLMLAGAIVFLLAGGLSILLGYRARWGAGCLAVFLVLATWYFHDFWNVQDVQLRHAQQIQFLKNVSLLGATLLLMANGTGRWSLDRQPAARQTAAAAAA